MCVCVTLTELFHKLLHVKVEGVDDGTPRLIVVVIDCHRGEAAAHIAFLKHVQLDLRAEVLPQEVCGRAASDTGADNRYAGETDTALVSIVNSTRTPYIKDMAAHAACSTLFHAKTLVSRFSVLCLSKRLLASVRVSSR